MDLFKDIFAQLLTDPQGSVDGVVAAIAAYKPYIYKILNELFGLYKDLVDNEEYYEYIAKDKMNEYQSLLNAGFTEDQAFILLLNKGVQRDELYKRFQETSKAKVQVKY